MISNIISFGAFSQCCHHIEQMAWWHVHLHYVILPCYLQNFLSQTCDSFSTFSVDQFSSIIVQLCSTSRPSFSSKDIFNTHHRSLTANTILQVFCMSTRHVLWVLSHSVMSSSLRPHGLQPTRLLYPWGFFRQENWSGLSHPPPGDLPNSGIEPGSPAIQADSFPDELPGKPS